MKKIILLTITFTLAFSFFSSNNVDAQFVNDGIYVKENAPGRTPVPYPSIREADVMWAKRIWRIVDLRQKMNHPFYYPTEPIGGRMSLFDLIRGKEREKGIFLISQRDRPHEYTDPRYWTIISDRWKVYDNRLYDLENDPDERIDVSAQHEELKENVIKIALGFMSKKPGEFQKTKSIMDEELKQRLRSLGYIK